MWIICRSVGPRPTFSAACALKKFAAEMNLRISRTMRSSIVAGSGGPAGSRRAAEDRDLAFVDGGMRKLLTYSKSFAGKGFGMEGDKTELLKSLSIERLA